MNVINEIKWSYPKSVWVKNKLVVGKIFIRRDPMKLKIKSYKLFLLIFLVPFTSLGQSIDSNIEETISLGDCFHKEGGLCGLVFFLLLVFLIIKNSLLLREKGLLKPDLYSSFHDCFKNGNITEVKEICKKNESLITTILSEGLERISDENYDQKEVTDAIEEAGNEQMIIYMKSINYLSIIGGTAPNARFAWNSFRNDQSIFCNVTRRNGIHQS